METAHRDRGSLTRFSPDRFRAWLRLRPMQDKPPQIVARTSYIVFSDAAGEYQQIEPFKHRNHCGYLLAHGITKHLNGESCIGT